MSSCMLGRTRWVRVSVFSNLRRCEGPGCGQRKYRLNPKNGTEPGLESIMIVVSLYQVKSV